LFFVLPKPQLQYEVSDRLTLYVGANIKSATYRTGETFGNEHGRGRLNSAIVDYTEFRVGAGATWQVMSNLDLNLEGGYTPYRTFDYSRAHTQTKLDAAPYVEISASAKF
ncbi:MAG: hypothetical protein V4507_14815, partial [Verrucomicrobiota bacterium]